MNNNDEGKKLIENKTYREGFGIFAIVFIFVTAIESFFGESRTLSVMSSLIWILASTAIYERYRVTKRKVYLVAFILGCFSSILFLANYLLKTLT